MATKIVAAQIEKEEISLKFWKETLHELQCGGIVETPASEVWMPKSEKWFPFQDRFSVGNFVVETQTIIFQGHHIPKIKQTIRELESGLKFLKTVHG